MTFNRRLATALVGPAVLLAGLVSATPAQSATADPGTTTTRIMNCLVDMDRPTARGGRVSARIATRGCSGGVQWRAELQSSRWYGWHTDTERSWRGSQTHVLSASCAGVHDHRLVVWATVGGRTSPGKAGPTARLNCG